MFGAGIALAMAMSLTLAVSPAAQADETTPGSFNTVQSQRLLDTRSGLGAPKASVAAGATLTFDATAGIEGSVGSVVLNVTAVAPQVRGHLTVFAAGSVRPYASNLNFAAGQNVPNLVVTPVGAGGMVSIYNGSAGTVHLLADIHGYYVGGASTGVSGTLVSMNSVRFLDTRNAIGVPKARVPANSSVTVQVGGVGGVPEGVAAVVANVTSVQADVRGWLNAYNGSPMPTVSTLNFAVREDRANLALISVGSDGTITVFNGSAGAVDMVLDVTGYYVGGTPATDGTLVTSTPYRIFDSRLDGGDASGALTTSKIRVFPEDDPTFSLFIKAVVVNVTAVQPETAGYLTTWDGTGTLPSVSSSNFKPKQDVAGAVVVPVNPDGTISIYNGSYGQVDLVVDITAFIFALPDFDIQDMSRSEIAAAEAVPAQKRIAEAKASLQRLSNDPASAPVSVTVG